MSKVADNQAIQHRVTPSSQFTVGTDTTDKGISGFEFSPDG